MFTFAKPLDEITEGDLQRLITDRIEENRQLEYKRELPSTSEGEKREFVRDVVSFANSAGGHIILVSLHRKEFRRSLLQLPTIKPTKRHYASKT